MKPIYTEKLPGDIEAAYVVRLDTEERQTLSVREESRCHFFAPFIIDSYRVILRLDWTDLDENGQPTLDADFYDIESDKKLRNRGARRAAHHTKAVDSERRVYEWTFKDDKLAFKVVVLWNLTTKSAMKTSDEVTIDVYRNGVKRDE